MVERGGVSAVERVFGASQVAPANPAAGATRVKIVANQGGLMPDLIKRYTVSEPGSVRLDDWDPKDKSGCPKGKSDGAKETRKLNARLAELQEVLYAQRKHAVLIVLQGMDTSGKDGAIRHVFDQVNPQGVRVASFGVPAGEEREHDFLWRTVRRLPRRGEIVIFNRSYYEGVLAERVRGITPEAVWSKRYDHINAFEKMLGDEGTLVLKFYLHIDADEQKKRLRARLKDRTKHWKLSVSDIENRRVWPQFQDAYEDMLSRTSTAHAPWHIVPANAKWYRNLIVSATIVQALDDLDMTYPPLQVDLNDYRID